MKKFLTIMMLLVAVACGKKEDTTQPSSNIPREQGMAMVGQQTLSDANGFLTMSRWRSGFFFYKVPPNSNPILYKKLNKSRILSGCGDSQIQGDTTDNDTDGIPVNAYFTINCDTTLSDTTGTYQIKVQGKVSAQDPNDNDQWVGKIIVDNPSRNDNMFLLYFGIPSYQPPLYVEFLFNYDVSSSHSGNTYSTFVNEKYAINATDSTGNPQSFGPLNLSLNLSFTSNDPTWTPENDTLNGSLEIEGSVSYQNENWSISTPTPLVYNGQCFEVGDSTHVSSAPVSGELLFQYQSDQLRIQVTGCRTCNIYFNNQQIGTCQSEPVQ